MEPRSLATHALEKHGRRRLWTWISLGLAAVATGSYLVCGGSHWCMDGHMRHPPYTVVEWLNDIFWTGGYLSAALALQRSSLPGRQVFGFLLFLLCASFAFKIGWR